MRPRPPRRPAGASAHRHTLARVPLPEPDEAPLSAEPALLGAALAQSSRRQIFRELWELAHDAPIYQNFDLMPRATIPYMDEPWYC